MLKFCENCVKLLKNSTSSVYFNRFYNVPAIKQLKKRPIISCRRKEFDFYGKLTDKLGEIKLASKGWHHNKSKGDYFIIHMTDELDLFQNTTFKELGLNNKLLDVLDKQNIKQPTNIQCKSIPAILDGKNTILAAETGSGKTLAYLLPVVNQILEFKSSKNIETKFNSPFCLVLSPSRELALQIHGVADNLFSDLDIKTSVLIGGSTKRKMLNPHFTEMDILVATPGAVSKLTTAGVYKMDSLQHVVLDEADTLLDESFSERISFILRKFPFSFHKKDEIGIQLTLASATMPSVYPDVISDLILPESLVKITTENLHKILPHVPQRFLRIGYSMRPSQLLQLIKNDYAKKYPVMIFSNYAGTCDWISMFLNENGIECANLNGDMNLYIRKDKFRAFQKGEINVISTTDVASRGLDTTRVKHIINYEFPKHTADYLHRCGRTGRIGSPERCHITNFIAGQQEVDLAQKIELAIRRMESLPNVNANISGIIKNRILRSLNEQ